MLGQSALQPGHSSFGGILPFGQRRAGRMLERARQVLAPMFVEFAERQSDSSAQVLIIGGSECVQKSSFLVVDIAPAPSHPRIEHTRLDRAHRFSTALRSCIGKGASARTVAGALGNLCVG